jgi:hypothetical protein
MGWKLYREVADYAPDSLTHRELYVATRLALTAFDGGDKQRSMPARTIRLPLRWKDQAAKRYTAEYTELLRTLRLPSDRQLDDVFAALVKKNVLKHTAKGQKNGRPEYVFLPLCPDAGLQNAETPRTEPQNAEIPRTEPVSERGNPGSQNAVIQGSERGNPVTETPSNPDSAREVAPGETQGDSKETQQRGAAARNPQLARLRKHRPPLSGDDFQTLTDNLEAARKKPDSYIGRALSQQAKQDKGEPVDWVDAVADLLGRYRLLWRLPGR